MFQKLIFNKEALIKAVREINADALVSLNTEMSEAFIYTTEDRDFTKIQSLVANYSFGASNQQDKAAKLVASTVAKSDDDELIDSDTSSADSEYEGLDKEKNVAAEKFSDKIEIERSKFMKNVLSRKKKILEDEKSSTRVSLKYLSTTSFALVAEVRSNDKKLFDKAVEAIKSWRVVFKRREFKQNEFDILEKQKKIIIDKTRQIDEDVNINFNPKTRFSNSESAKKRIA